MILQSVGTNENQTYVVEVLAHLLKESIVGSNIAKIKPCQDGQPGEMHVRLFWMLLL